MDERRLHQIQILAGIGHVCLQWALLETTLLAVLNVFQNLPTDEGAIIFGSLSMQNRLNMAVNLARHHKAPQKVLTELIAMRKTLQDDKGGVSLADRRNQAVHGAHQEGLEADTVSLTMFSWNEAKRQKDLTFEDFTELAEEISALQRRGYRVFEDLGRWKFPGHGEKNRSNDLGMRPA